MKKIKTAAIASAMVLTLSTTAFGGVCANNSYSNLSYGNSSRNVNCSTNIKGTIDWSMFDCVSSDCIYTVDGKIVSKETNKECVTNNVNCIPNGEDNSGTTDDNTNDTNNEELTTEKAYALEVIKLVNEEREANGLATLATNSAVSEAAQKRAEEIVNYFSHTRPNGSKCFTVLTEFGITYVTAGENIAYGQKTAENVMASWMASAGHKANILSTRYTDIGVGCYIADDGTIYWTQMFIR